MPRCSPPGFFGLSRCLVLTPGLTSEYLTCSVCVCVRIHTYAPTYTPTPVKNRENIPPQFCFVLFIEVATPLTLPSHLDRI